MGRGYYLLLTECTKKNLKIFLIIYNFHINLTHYKIYCIKKIYFLKQKSYVLLQRYRKQIYIFFVLNTECNTDEALPHIPKKLVLMKHYHIYQKI